MQKKWMAVIGSGALVIGVAVAGVSFAGSDNPRIHNGTIRVQKQSEAEFPSMAKIPMDQAVQEALGSVQGQILKVKLEDEDGFLVYGVEVVSADKAIMDVKVDAGSGKVLAVERDKEDREDHEKGEHEERDDKD